MHRLRRISRLPIVIGALFFGGCAPSARGQDANPPLADRARAFLRTYCYDCHGGPDDRRTRLTDVLDSRVLLAKPGNPKQKPFVVPGDAANSLLWIMAGKAPFRMPPDDAEKTPGDAERKVLEQWIQAGAPLPKAAGRTPAFIDDATAITAIRGHLRDTIKPADRPFQRYITLVHLHNNPTIADETIRSHRAAVSKLLNSLSWQAEIAIPRTIDAGSQVILNIDLRAYGWEASDWDLVEKAYPYGVLHNEDEALFEAEKEIIKLTGTRLPVMRGDWFVATASRPPLYDRLLKLPATLGELEVKKLGVHLERNFDDGTLRRGGLITSGVSRHNRLVERHRTPFGAYWRSYDFKTSAGRGNLLLFPLGPRFRDNEFDDQAFEQAGGEVIFNLPNGLQGYMLADAKDNRLDAPAPVAIVSDQSEAAGTPEIVNGLSCLACHSSGMKSFRDEIRAHPAVFARARRKVEQLHPLPDEMDKLLAKDEDRFLRAVDEAMGDFLRSGDLAKADVRELVRRINEPIGEVARLYVKDLTPEAVAAELGLPNVEALKGAILGNPKLQEFGLGPLLDAHALKRELWEDDPELSLFHRVATEFGRGPNTKL
jgi:Planctomycete cytochrome C